MRRAWPMVGGHPASLALVRGPVKGTRRVVAAALLLTAVGAGDAAGQSLSDEQIVRNFDLIAFRNEFVEVEDPRVVKWTDSLRVYLNEDVSLEGPVRAYLDRHLERLADATRLAISYVPRAEAANFIIVFTRRDAYEDYVSHNAAKMRAANQAQVVRRSRRSNCIGMYSFNAHTFVITSATVIIPIDHAWERGLLTRCIAEETAQMLGLPNDSEEVNPSIFNDRSTLVDITPADLTLLRLLYHPDLKPGMPRDEALSHARRLLPEMRE